MADINYKVRPFKATEMNEVFLVVNKAGITRMGMPGDYLITYDDASQDVMAKKELEKTYEVKTV